MLYRGFTIISLMMLGTALLAGSLLNEFYRGQNGLTPFISATLETTGSHNKAAITAPVTAMPLANQHLGG